LQFLLLPEIPKGCTTHLIPSSSDLSIHDYRSST
jgi:hypothetical protein